MKFPFGKSSPLNIILDSAMLIMQTMRLSKLRLTLFRAIQAIAKISSEIIRSEMSEFLQYSENRPSFFVARTLAKIRTVATFFKKLHSHHLSQITKTLIIFDNSTDKQHDPRKFKLPHAKTRGSFSSSRSANFLWRIFLFRSCTTLSR